MNKIHRQSLKSLKSSHVYEGCTIYTNKCVGLTNTSFRSCSFRERELEFLKAQNCVFHMCNFNDLELNFCKNLRLYGGYIEKLTITKGALSWVGNNIIVKKLRIPVCKWSLDDLRKVKDLQSLDFTGYTLADDVFKHIQKSFCNLHELNLSNTLLTTITHLENITSLRNLNISYNNISNWQSLAKLENLEHLNLEYTNITNSDLQILQELPNLQSLYLGHTNIGLSGIKMLENCLELRVLELPKTKVCDACIDSYAKIPKLERLNLYQSAISVEGLQTHHQRLSKCKVFPRMPDKVWS